MVTLHPKSKCIMLINAYVSILSLKILRGCWYWLLSSMILLMWRLVYICSACTLILARKFVTSCFVLTNKSALAMFIQDRATLKLSYRNQIVTNEKMVNNSMFYPVPDFCWHQNVSRHLGHQRVNMKRKQALFGHNC